MHTIDWIILSATLAFIVMYGYYKTRKQDTVQEYLLGNQDQRWWQVGLGVMATQASAITFISTTGQGYSDGMKFVQFYFGLPIAMLVIGFVFIPIFYKEKVTTAYEYLEIKFDLKTRLFASIIFLIQRGLAVGITLYAPSIILSIVLGWNLQMTHVICGILVILYTVSGGSKAVSVTQMQQMAVIFIGMFFAFGYMVYTLPDDYSFFKTISIADQFGKMDTITYSFDLRDRYNLFSGLVGGFFLALAYFGTDQSQVQRYLTGQNIKQSRMGLLFNGIFKIPMQYFILLCGVLLSVYMLFQSVPLSFNPKVENYLKEQHADQFSSWSVQNTQINEQRKSLLLENKSPELIAIKDLNSQQSELRKSVSEFVKKNNSAIESNDKDYIFLHYILHFLPHGLIGLLIAVILCAAMSSISAEINALAGVCFIDLKLRLFPNSFSSVSELQLTRYLSIFWGLFALSFAFYANLFENLIQFINIIGSLFYGSVLGIFLVAFLFKKVSSNVVFYSAIAAQAIVLILFFTTDLGFLWYTMIATSIVVCLSAISLIKVKAIYKV
ncbi:MAG: sodium:solute symporter [Saprospiraceae bacterium]|nr:sodium:solute symporter [Saprospiraceae bacterium]